MERTQSLIELEGIDPLEFYGVNNAKYNRIASHFTDLRVTARDMEIQVEGPMESVGRFSALIYQLLSAYHRIGRVEMAYIDALLRGEAPPEEGEATASDRAIVFGPKGKVIYARTPHQQALVEECRASDLVFAIGAAGSGKTYTAIALAVNALKCKTVRRIILTRPAVEAGERLGFLPGDLKEKLDPYLQPLYDALNDMLPPRLLASKLEDGTIQIAPLAYMRGRTLDNAFVILDEAQNATRNQMKMFLTRMGRNAKFVVTGDVTQIDLPAPQQSGLAYSVALMRGISGISVVEFTTVDIVRHALVAKIVRAFDEAMAMEQEKLEQPDERPNLDIKNVHAMCKTVVKTDFLFPDQQKVYHGKVRDAYFVGTDTLVMVVTDRISAFDVVLPWGIPQKGAVLNLIAAEFLDATRDIVPNWKLATPHPMVTIGLQCKPYPIEMIVRGYLSGHAWRQYAQGRRELCGETLPDGLKENDRLPKPIVTPTTKAVEGHDEDISGVEIVKRGLVSQRDYDELVRYALALFERGSEMATKRGLILVDTKYEFGQRDGKIYLIDEIHTPDSSRYFYLDGYDERQQKAIPQRQLSKEFVRQWLIEQGFQGNKGDNIPALTPEKEQEVSARYIELYEHILGKKFVPLSESHIVEAIEKSVMLYLKGE